MDELLTVAEVAKILRLNQQTVRNMIDRHELAAVRVGRRRVRIRTSDLEAFLTTDEIVTGPGENAAPQVMASCASNSPKGWVMLATRCSEEPMPSSSALSTLSPMPRDTSRER
jgi:excisionase family DNA binding protein